MVAFEATRVNLIKRETTKHGHTSRQPAKLSIVKNLQKTPLGTMVNGGLINHIWRNVDGVRNEQSETAVVL